MCLPCFPLAAQEIDVAALWDRYIETCTPFATDVPAAIAALEPLAEGAELARAGDGQALRYELGDADGLVGNHIEVNRVAGASGVYCAVFDFQVGDPGAEALEQQVRALLVAETGAEPAGGAAELSAHPETGLRIFESNDYWAVLSAAGALPLPGLVTFAEIQREDYGGIFATGVTFGFNATVPDAE